ncbi:MAG: hypothetical protein ACLTTJ_05690 [Blautia sp.]
MSGKATSWWLDGVIWLLDSDAGAYGSFCPNAELSCFIIYCITAVSSVLTTMFFFLPVIKNLLQGKGIDTSGRLVYWISCRTEGYFQRVLFSRLYHIPVRG